MKIELKYMRRALELARMGEIGAHPNPMVGAVIVDSDGSIIGEGYHRTCGQAHAEVNAVRMADDLGHDLSQSTIYVTLEPCAHWGKTPPCAQMIIDRDIPRVVVGTVDPFAKVQGKGIEMMRAAGVEVTVIDGPLADECRELNRRFFTAHTLGRPYVALKWAQSSDGFIDRERAPEDSPTPLSTAASKIVVHRYRSGFDAIAVGSRTEITDRPRLDARLWPGGRAPQKVKLHRGDLEEQLRELYRLGITSLLIEGGATLHKSFIDSGLWDELRIEVSPLCLGAGVKAPLSELKNVKVETLGVNTLFTCQREGISDFNERSTTTKLR